MGFKICFPFLSLQMSDQCWADGCTTVMKKRDDLRTHLAGHGFTRVYCPWCDSDRSHRRMIDLKQHVKAHHTEIYKSSVYKDLTEHRGFVLAVRPAEYRRATGTPTEDIATDGLKELMRKWCGRCPDRRDLKEIEESWHLESTPYSPTKPDLHQLADLAIQKEHIQAVIWVGGTKFRRVRVTMGVLSEGRKRDAVMRRMTSI